MEELTAQTTHHTAEKMLRNVSTIRRSCIKANLRRLAGHGHPLTVHIGYEGKPFSVSFPDDRCVRVNNWGDVDRVVTTAAYMVVPQA